MAADAADIVFADGTLTIAGADRSIPIAQVAQMQFTETRNYHLRREHALGQLLLGKTGQFLPLFCAPDGKKPAGGNRGLEPFDDLAEQPRREKSVREAPRLSGRYRAEIGAGPDEAVYLAHHDP